MTATDAPTFRLIPLAQLHESPLNPRKTFDPKAMEDLVASVKAKGVITPLLVRPNAKGYEIAAGHRRYRAATAAELTEVPAVVRPMTDVEFVEVLVMENDEREDLHPLEEAEGYRTLMTKAGYSVERIAERRGCSVKYVYDRVKLLSLIPEAQQLFREHRFTAGHAILLARLKPEDQQRALKDGVFEHEEWLLPRDVPGPHSGQKPVSVRELEGWIDEHVRFDTSAIDQVVFPAVADVVARAQEAEEKIVKITHDYHVQDEARDPKERTYGPMSWKRADGSHKSKPCEYAVTGVIVVGPGRGEAFKVCINKDKCATHWGAEKRERARRAKLGQVGGSRKSEQDRWKLEQEKREQERKRQEAEHARWTKATPKILEAIAAAVKKAPTKATGLLAEIILEQVKPDVWSAGKATMAKAADLIPRGTTAEDLVRHAAMLVLAGEVAGWGAAEDFPKRAKAFGLDVRSIVDEVAPRAKEEKAEPAAKAAKGKRR